MASLFPIKIHNSSEKYFSYILLIILLKLYCIGLSLKLLKIQKISEIVWAPSVGLCASWMQSGRLCARAHWSTHNVHERISHWESKSSLIKTSKPHLKMDWFWSALWNLFKRTYPIVPKISNYFLRKLEKCKVFIWNKQW